MITMANPRWIHQRFMISRYLPYRQVYPITSLFFLLYSIICHFINYIYKFKYIYIYIYVYIYIRTILIIIIIIIHNIYMYMYMYIYDQRVPQQLLTVNNG